jgi:hypothetical protein
VPEVAAVLDREELRVEAGELSHAAYDTTSFDMFRARQRAW